MASFCFFIRSIADRERHSRHKKSSSSIGKRTFFSVRRMRLELTHRNRHYPLKVACLPISPSAQINMREKMYCAQNRTRTCTALRPLVPETSVSTNFTIWANGNSVVERKKAKLFRFAFCFKFQERKTGLEPATPTLARSCSTN